MAIKVMNRLESKYIITESIYHDFIKTVEKYTRLDEYNKNSDFYTISNIYYDTFDNSLIRASISKPEYKEKLRLRAYGIPAEGDNVFIEIKKKHLGLVNKRRVELPLKQAYDFLINHHSEESSQIINELSYTLKKYKPVPKVYIAYDRRAYFGENELRITFDKNIRTRRHDLQLEIGGGGTPLLKKGVYIIEIKANGALPLWLARFLSENGIYKASFSKYGTEYIKFLKNGGEEKCLNQFFQQQKANQPQRLHSIGKMQLPQYV